MNYDLPTTIPAFMTTMPAFIHFNFYNTNSDKGETVQLSVSHHSITVDQPRKCGKQRIYITEQVADCKSLLDWWLPCYTGAVSDQNQKKNVLLDQHGKILPNDGARASPFGYKVRIRWTQKSAMTVLQYEDATSTYKGESTWPPLDLTTCEKWLWSNETQQERRPRTF